MSRSRDYFMTTERLGFSLWREDDLPLATNLWANPRVSSLIGGPSPPEEVGARLKREIECMVVNEVRILAHFSALERPVCWMRWIARRTDSMNAFSRWCPSAARELGPGFCWTARLSTSPSKLWVLKVSPDIIPQTDASRRLIEKLGFHFTHDEFRATGLNHPSYLLANPGISRVLG